MTTIPTRTYIYSLAVTAAALVVLISDWYRTGFSWEPKEVQIGIILFLMIVLAERFKLDLPSRNLHYSMSVGAVLGLGAATTLQPLDAALIVIGANVIVDASMRLRPVQVMVNGASLGLSTFLASSVYWLVAAPGESPVSSPTALLAVIAASIAYCTVNLGTLAVVVAPIVGDSPLDMWRANFTMTYVLLSLPMLGSLVPITAAQSSWGVVILSVALAGSHLALRSLREVERETQATIVSLTDALEVRDSYTNHHSARVTEYVEAILDEMPHVPSRLKLITIEAARIHDVGKIGIKDDALLKAGPLTDDERAEMQRHSVIGADIVGNLGIYRHSSAIVRHHHERWDGKGYPDGISGEDIPFGSRVIAVADSFDAMTSNRPYRRALNFTAAVEEIVRNSGTQFDPQVVEAFQRAMTKPIPAVEPDRSAIVNPLFAD